MKMPNAALTPNKKAFRRFNHSKNENAGRYVCVGNRWLSADPALGDYLPSAPVNGEARRRNGNLPGMGGVFNYVNLHAYHYAGNNPVKYIDPDGRSDEPNILIVNMPGFTDGRLENLLIAMGWGRYDDADLIGVVAPKNGTDLARALAKYKDQASIIILAGGHSNEFFPPNSFNINLPNDVQVYFATCEEALDKRAIAGSLGLPQENIHFNTGLSWANNSYNFIQDIVYLDMDPNMAYQKYIEANKDYQENPSHRMDWMSEE
jgi:hypothetical protein